MTLVTLSTANPATDLNAMLLNFGLPVLLILFFYLFFIRPQKKRDKETALMRSKIEVGDEIITIGGIIGRVVSLRDETLVIETGSDRSKIRIARWAIQQNNTAKGVD